MSTSDFFHGKLPSSSDLLAGREPPSDVGWQSDELQIWFNNTSEPWADPGSHVHDNSDEIFIVLEGSLLVEVGGEERFIRAGEFCCFRKGTSHSVISVTTPVKTFMVRAPSIDDKRYIE